MAHMLDMTNGRANMAYRLDGGIPWHGMGQIILPDDSLEVIAEKGGLDWQALIVPAQYMFGGTLRTAENSFHMVRSDNGASLSVMSKRYKPHQPHEILAFYRDFVLTDERFAIETVGSLKGGRLIWCLAKFNAGMTVAGDAHTVYVLFSTSFDGSVATRAVATFVRVVCFNTITAALCQADREKAYISVRHSVDFGDPAVRADASDRFAKVVAEFDNYKALGEALAGVNLAAFQVEGLFRSLTIDKAAKGDAEKEEAPTGRAKAAFERLLSSYRDTLAEGTKGGTAWAVLNGVTRYVDHNRTVRDTENDGKAGAKFASSLFGSGASLKREAILRLAEIGNLELAA